MTKTKATDIVIPKKYKALFKILNNNQSSDGIDTVIITGGRGSGKSFVVAIFNLVGVVQQFWKVLFSRFTGTSIGDSIREEVAEKIEILEYHNQLFLQNRQIIDSDNQVRVSFKGLKTGSKSQKANLKSIKGFNIWTLDEAEECPDFETFQKIYLSIRHKDKRNLSILVLNPAYKQHWIFEHFFLNRGVESGFNGVHENVLYIHTSYLDLPKDSLPDNIIKEYDRMKIDNPKMYNNVVLGGWLDKPEGVLIPLEDLRLFPNDIQEGHIRNICFIDPSEKNGDMMSCIFCNVSMIDNALNVHVYDVVHSNIGYEVISSIVNQKAIDTNVDEVIVEKNGVGVATVLMLHNLNFEKKYKLTPYHSKVNKEVKISTNYEFIKRHFSFDVNYKESKQYKLFVSHLTMYSIEENEPHTIDAMDVCASASRMIKVMYNKLI